MQPIGHRPNRPNRPVSASLPEWPVGLAGR